MLVNECVELVDQSLRADPTQCALTDGELAGVVTDDDRVAQKLVRLNGAPQRTVRGNPQLVQRHATWPRLVYRCSGLYCPGLSILSLSRDSSSHRHRLHQNS